MKWRTEQKIENQIGNFSYADSSLSIGSCFSDEIARRLKNAGFDISVNPFGVIFNPVSILQLIQNALDGTVRENMFLERDMKHFHYGYHSVVSDATKQELSQKIDGIQFNVQRKLLQGDHLILTFGSAWAWRLKEENVIVANCHKMPGNLFTKELINLQRLVEFSDLLFKRIFDENPKLKVMVTVSPVRHIKEGLHNNNISKSVLHLFCKHLIEKHGNITYFPSYELVMDDLRDYRFFKEDLIHPSNQAVDYVFERFMESQFDDITKRKFSLHEQLKKAEQHHFMNATIEEVKQHEEFIQKLKQQIVELGQ